MNTKVRLLFILFISSLCLGFTACSDDDNDDDNYGKKIAGTYVGSINIAALGITVPDVELTLSRQNDKKVQISMKQEIMSGMEIDIETISDDITFSNNVYHVSAVASYSYQPEPLPVPMILPITVEGTVTPDGEANLVIGVGEGVDSPPFPLDVIYEGQKE